MKKVNFLEAIKSNKRFRVKGKEDWLFVNDFGEIFIFGKGKAYINKTTFLSEFELEEKEITITESDFNSAVCNCRIAELGFDHMTSEFLKELKEKLGF